jgi:hypothetical protein
VSRGRAAVLILAAVILVAAAVVVAVNLTSGTSRPRPHSLKSVTEPLLAPQVPAHGAYFGAWVKPQAYTQMGQVDAVDLLEAQLGRRLDIVHTYLTWQGAFPTASDQAAINRGSMLLVSWAGTDSRTVISGVDDSLIRQRAREIKAIGKPVFLEWRWEMNRPNLRGVVGSSADFIAAWKHVRAIFGQEHVDNVAWVWCPTANGFEPGGNAAAYYPGNAEVNWICTDAYPGFGQYRSFAATVQPFLTWASQYRKPVMIGEYGVPQSYQPDQRVQWLRAAAQTVQDDPQIKALVYFDSSPAGSFPADSFSLDDDSPALQAFRSIADSTYFNPDGVRLTG